MHTDIYIYIYVSDEVHKRQNMNILKMIPYNKYITLIFIYSPITILRISCGLKYQLPLNNGQGYMGYNTKLIHYEVI